MQIRATRIGRLLALILLTLGAAAVAAPVLPAAPLEQTCDPRPAIQISSVPTKSGQLRFSVVSGTNASRPRNELHSVQFASLTNARISAGMFSQAVPFRWDLAPGTTS